MLYGVQVMIKARRMADKVLAAFLSAFFSCVFFFFLTGGFVSIPLPPDVRVFGTFLAFNGILMSGMCEGRLIIDEGLASEVSKLRTFPLS